MPDFSDRELLAQYALHRSEEAFAALVSRHLNLVYSVALRRAGDPHQAEDIAQVVFLLLAKKAGDLPSGTILSGWLYRTAQLTAANFLRMEYRRQRREQEVYMQSLVNAPGTEMWTQIAPELETAMDRLGARERHAILLRFFEGKNLREVGEAIGVTESTAQKSVERALEKLRVYFTRRGATLTIAALAALLSAQSVQAAPAQLAGTITATAFKGAAASSSVLTLLQSTAKLMTWLKIKLWLYFAVSAAVVAGVATVSAAHFQQIEPTPSWSTAQAAAPLWPGILRKDIAADVQLYTPELEPLSSQASVPTNLPDPQDASGFLKRGRIYLSRGNYDAAIADFDQAIQLKPNYTAAFFARGRASKLKGDYVTAFANYSEAIRLNPQMIEPYVNRGQLYNIASEYDLALADLNTAIRLDPQRPIPYLNRGVSFSAKGDYEKAEADFYSALALDSNFPIAWNNLAWLLATCPQAALRDGKKAVDAATHACDLSNWQNISQLDTLAAAYAEAGDFDNAVKWETTVLETPGLAAEDSATAKDRLVLYKSHQPYHRPPFGSSSPSQ